MTNLRNRVRLLRDYLLGRTQLKGLPFHLYIEPTNRCNLRCPMCNRTRDPLPLGDMSLSLLGAISSQNRGALEVISVFGEGEPLLHPLIFEMIALVKQAGIAVEISTNATMLDETRRNRLLACPPDYVLLAFDGTTPQVYAKYRPGAEYAQVKENIERFLELKRRTRAPIRATVQMVLFPENAAQGADFLRMWATRGADALRLKENHFCQAATMMEGGERPRCWNLWRGPLLVRYNGDVLPCTHFLGEPPIGNLSRQSLNEIWNSSEMQRLREAHVLGKLEGLKPCAKCPAPYPNRPLTIASFLAPVGVISRLLPYFERLQFRGLPVFRRAHASKAIGSTARI